MARYSLATYILSIKLPQEFASQVGLAEDSVISVGGEGSYLDSFGFSYDNDLFTTRGDTTGSWVHDKNLSRTGTCTISIHQLSDKVALFKQLMNLYYQSTNDYDGLHLILEDSLGRKIVDCEDCYFSKMPDQNFGRESENQSWSLTCGRITMTE